MDCGSQPSHRAAKASQSDRALTSGMARSRDRSARASRTARTGGLPGGLSCCRGMRATETSSLMPWRGRSRTAVVYATVCLGLRRSVVRPPSTSLLHCTYVPLGTTFLYLLLAALRAGGSRDSRGCARYNLQSTVSPGTRIFRVNRGRRRPALAPATLGRLACQSIQL